MFSEVNQIYTDIYLVGKRIPYLTTTPKHHKGNRYIFQFHGSGGLDLKQRVKESWINKFKGQNEVSMEKKLNITKKTEQLAYENCFKER